MHTVALEKAVLVMCLDLIFVTGRNSLNLTKPKAIALRFCLKFDSFAVNFESL